MALSRGREANYAYLIAQRDADAHQPERLDSTAAGRMAGVLSNGEARHAAETERRIGARDGASLAWIGTQWDEVSRDCARARYTEQLSHVLDPDAVTALTAEAGWPRLVRAVREAELAGHNTGSLLASAIEGRQLADAQQVSDVLRYRVRVLAEGRTPEQEVGAGDWTALAPPTDGPVGQFTHELAVLAQDRQHELGRAALEQPPGWALEQLGPVPSYEDLARSVDAGVPVSIGAVDQVAAARVEWAQRAGAVAAYRELRGIAEHATSIGAAPSREEEFHRQLWTQAAAALGQESDPGAVDYRTMADLDLYAVRERWVREQAWAPEYVAEEMRAAYALGREYTEDAALAGARLSQLEPDDEAWEQTAAQLQRSERLAELTLERARQLDEIRHSRGGWYDATEDARVADELARDELERRGLPAQRELERVEQLELFDPADTIAETEINAVIETEPVTEVEPAAELEQVDIAFDEHVDVGQHREQVDVGPALVAGVDTPQQAERAVNEPERVDEPHRVELDAVELEQRDERVEVPERAAAEPELEQLALLEVERDVADKAGAEPLRAPEPDPAAEQARTDAAAAERERQERARLTLAEARRSAEGADAQREAREAAAATTAALERARESIQTALAALETTAAERAGTEEAERREQLNRWHEQDRAAEMDQGLDQGGPTLGMG